MSKYIVSKDVILDKSRMAIIDKNHQYVSSRNLETI